MRKIAGSGRGLVACKTFNPGDVIYTETPTITGKDYINISLKGDIGPLRPKTRILDDTRRFKIRLWATIWP